MVKYPSHSQAAIQSFMPEPYSNRLPFGYVVCLFVVIWAFDGNQNEVVL